MKKILFTLLVLSAIVVSGSAFAQGSAYQKGDKILNAGVSFAGFNYGYVGARSGGFIPLSASFELGIHESISVGPYIGYASWNYHQSMWGHQYTTSARMFALGARGSWHFLPLLNEHLELEIDEAKWDFYGTVQAGLQFRNSYVYVGDGKDGNSGHSNSVHFAIGPFLGVKYMINDKLGAFFEGGRGALGYGTLGISAKF